MTGETLGIAQEDLKFASQKSRLRPSCGVLYTQLRGRGVNRHMMRVPSEKESGHVQVGTEKGRGRNHAKWHQDAWRTHLGAAAYRAVFCVLLAAQASATHAAPFASPSVHGGRTDGWDMRGYRMSLGNARLGFPEVARLRGGQGLGQNADHVAVSDASHADATGLRIFCGTWNVNGKPPLVPIEDWLFTRSERDDVDVYVIALQEVQGLSGTAALLTDEEKGRPWSAILQQAVGAPLHFRCLAVRQMVGCYITLLVRTALCADVSDIRVGELGTGFLNSGGNKGGVAVRFTYRGVSVCAISSHLAAQVSEVTRTNTLWRAAAKHRSCRTPNFQSQKPRHTKYQLGLARFMGARRPSALVRGCRAPLGLPSRSAQFLPGFF